MQTIEQWNVCFVWKWILSSRISCVSLNSYVSCGCVLVSIPFVLYVVHICMHACILTFLCILYIIFMYTPYTFYSVFMFYANTKCSIIVHVSIVLDYWVGNDAAVVRQKIQYVCVWMMYCIVWAIWCIIKIFGIFFFLQLSSSFYWFYCIVWLRLVWFGLVLYCFVLFSCHFVSFRFRSYFMVMTMMQDSWSVKFLSLTLSHPHTHTLSLWLLHPASSQFLCIVIVAWPTLHFNELYWRFFSIHICDAVCGKMNNKSCCSVILCEFVYGSRYFEQQIYFI